MAILTFDEWIASDKQIIPWSRTTVRTTVANRWFAIHDLAGNPGAATLAVGNTANGVVPTDATAGYPPINFSTGIGYLSSVDFGSTVACRLTIYDRVFHAGAYSFNANTTLSSQPSYSGRMPNGSYVGTQLWYEQVTNSTGVPNVTVTYTNQAGTAGQSTGGVSVGATFIAGSMFQIPLAAGDSGVQKVESVVGATASAGTFNIVVARPVWTGRVTLANSGDCHGPDRTGMPQIFSDSALTVMVNADSTSSGLPDILFDIVSA